MNKILVTEFINQKSLDRLNKVFEVYYDEKLWRNSKKISKLIRDFDCLILRNKTIVNKSLLDKARKVKFIGRLGVGIDSTVKQRFIRFPVLRTHAMHKE